MFCLIFGINKYHTAQLLLFLLSIMHDLPHAYMSCDCVLPGVTGSLSIACRQTFAALPVQGC